MAKKGKIELLSDNEIRKIVSFAKDIVFVQDTHGTILFIANSVKNLLDFEPSGLTGEKIYVLIHEDDLHAYQNNLERSGSNDLNNTSTVIRIKNSNNEYFWFEVISHAFETDNGAERFCVNCRFNGSVRQTVHTSRNDHLQANDIPNKPLCVLLRFNRKFEHLYASPSVSDIIPFHRNEVKGLKIDETGFHPERIKLLKKLVNQVFEKGENIEEQLEQETTGGKTLQLNWKFFPEFDKDNRIFSVLVVIEEITKIYKDVSQRNIDLQESEIKFQTFMDNSPYGIIITDENAQIENWNRRMKEFTGIDHKGTKKKSLVDVYEQLRKYITSGPKPDLGVFNKIIKSALSSKNGKKVVKEELSVDLPEKEEQSLEVISFTIPGDKGNRIGVIIKDLTERKKSERYALLYKDIFMNNEDGIAILDPEGKYLKQNPQHKELLGYDDEQIIGKDPSIMLSEKIFKEVFKVFDYQSVFDGELMARKKDGSEIYIDFILFNVVSQGEKLYIVSIVRDICNRKETEKELLHAKRKAEEADLLKTAFLSNMSHEIRTPMNSILGFSSLLENQDITSEQRARYISFINKNGENLLNLIGDIIDISKMESNQLKVNKKGCDLHELFDDIHENMKELMNREGKANIRLIKKISAPELVIFTDCMRLRQILVNLIHNAIKFTDFGFIEFGFTLDTEKEILFHVKDTGIGIPIEVRESIFQRFRKLEHSKKKIYGGAGLGLAISRQLVNLLGGKIWLESYVGKGTTFYFTIPNIPYSHPPKKKLPIKEIAKKSWPGKKVLIVEDDIYASELIIEYLSTSDLEYTVAANGKEAVGIFAENPDFDIILMDIQLPEMNGLEAASLIREIDKKIPIIALTAYAMDEDKEDAAEFGCNAFLPKPINRNDFLQKLSEFLG